MNNWYLPKLDEFFFASVGRGFFVVFSLLLFFIVPIIKNDLLRMPPQQVQSQVNVSNQTDSQNLEDIEKMGEKSDLAAQEGMWGAAVALVLLTTGQIFIGLITLGLIYNTFRVQKAELDVTSASTTYQLKPYFTVSLPKVRILPVVDGIDDSDTIILEATFVLENTGSTPAWNITPFQCFDFEFELDGLEFLKRRPPFTKLQGYSEPRLKILSPNEKSVITCFCRCRTADRTPISHAKSIKELESLGQQGHSRYTFAAEAFMEDIETRSLGGIYRRRIVVVGSNNPPNQGHTAFGPIDESDNKFKSDFEEGYYPMSRIRISEDKTAKNHSKDPYAYPYLQQAPV